jgi:hypothetical protein
MNRSMAASMIAARDLDSCSGTPVCGKNTVTGEGTGVAAPVEGSVSPVPPTGVTLAVGSATVGVSVAVACGRPVLVA